MSLNIRAYSFLIGGALDWRMVSATSVERPHPQLQPTRGANTDPLVVVIKYPHCVVGARTNTWRSLRSSRKCSKHGQHLQAVDVPREMVTTPQTAGRVATHVRSPIGERHPSLVSLRNKELPVLGPETRTGVSSTCLHVGIST